MTPRVLMIDNYDSFAYNLVQYFTELNCEVEVYRNDQITIDEICQLNPHCIVISPGPCTPNEAGISLQVIKRLGSQYPILGVCLGHQTIAQAFGGKIVQADPVMHGKVSAIVHNSVGLYEGLPSPLTVTRYHSLIVDATTLPDCLDITAYVEEGKEKQTVVMSFSHKTLRVYGVQYHPESILTEHGIKILRNFLHLAMTQ